MGTFARRAALAAVVSVGVCFTTLPWAHAEEERPQDYAVEGGRFYRQTAGESAQKGFGFKISDEDGTPFWSEFQRLGGVRALGFPISRRFVLDGFRCQATQRAILQWRPERNQVQLINVMEYLSRLGVDDRLAAQRAVPLPTDADSDDVRYGWLESNPKIRTVYEGAADPLAAFGLPLSPARDMGPATAMRFQRGVIYVWNQPQPWTGAEGVSVANAGDFVKESSGIPAEALQPEPPPPVREIAGSGSGSSRGGFRLAGVATWYGESFQGSPMANGEPYNMWDPTIAASNVHRLGTRLKVTRVATDSSIIVRVADRGAFRYPIIVDLSYAAFRSMANPGDGVMRVIVEPLD